MKNIYLLFASFFLLSASAVGQGIPIPQDIYDVIDYSSDNGNHPIDHAFDSDTATWWAIYDAAGFGLPAFVEVDFIDNFDVSGFSYLPNNANANDKAIGFKLYLSEDGDDWGDPEIVSTFDWEDPSDVSRKYVSFGAVTGEYVRLEYISSQNTGNNNIHTADLIFYESETPATGQMNQVITFDPIIQVYTEEETIELDAFSNSGLAITYEVISGPASVDGNLLTLSGEEGFVEIEASQAGDDDYYPTEISQVFEVIDLSLIYPMVSSRLSESHPIQMPEFYAYPIYVSTSIDESAALEITSVDIEIDGTSFEAIDNGRYYYYMWTPDSYEEHTIIITTNASNGNSESITRVVEVSADILDQNVLTMDDVVIEFGGENSRWFYGSYSLPQHIGSYDQIMANLSVECPEGNCDDWDRLAYIDIKDHAGNWIQLIRYITPYGVACDHDIEVTDYANLLQGDIEFRMFIDTWGTGGWQITLDFDFQEGTPEYLYSAVYDLWDGTWDLGNPANLQPVDTVDFLFESNVESAHMRLSTTGHGWGNNNSQNAAEFYHAINYIDIDSNAYYTQNLWNYCNPNPDDCSPQNGTYTYNRAGWCPGAISPPNIIDLDDQVGEESVLFTYRFAPVYVDYCHPNNPDCVSGFTCDDCNDGYNPHYVVDAHIISYSGTPIIQDALSVATIDNSLNYNVDVHPNPSNGIFRISSSNLEGQSKVRVLNMAGQDMAVYYFNTKDELESKSFDLSSRPSGIYFIRIENNKGNGVKKIVLQ